MAGTKTFSQLITAEQISSSDILALSVPFAESDTGYVSRKASLAQVMTEANTSFLYSTELNTENKTVFGAINEVKAQSDFFVTETAADIIEDVLADVTVECFSAAVTPATVTICCRLTFTADTISHGVKLFGIKNGYAPLGIIFQKVGTDAAISNNVQSNKIQIMDAGAFYYGAVSNATYIEMTSTYPRKQN